MKKIRIGLVEIGDSFGGQYYLPYSVGVLRAYAEKMLAPSEDYEFLPIIYKAEGIETSVKSLHKADIIFYSAYLWNFQASLKIARRIRKSNPDIINVFGGPQIPESKEKAVAFLRDHPFIEIVAVGEGESPFFKIIESFHDRQWNDVPSIGFRSPDGSISFNEFKETIRDINEIPSPYLSGIFDELIEQNPKELWQGRIETNRGCPFTCAFCYWGKESDRKVKQFDLDRVYQEIDWFSNKKIEFVFCCDANFGILKRDVDIARRVIDNKKVCGYPKAFSVQNTKNSTARIFELQKILNDAGLQKGVNLALQSLNKDTLRHIERSNIKTETYAELQALFSKSNIPTFTDLIIGLPGETYRSFTQGVSNLVESGQHNRIQFINLTVLENTLIADPLFQKEHGLVITETELIPHHSSLETVESVIETQHLVTATHSMPEEDWIRTWVFSWVVSLLHFDKLLQIPFIVLHEVYGISYKDLAEAFMKKCDGQTMLDDIVSTFEKKAVDIQKGGSEYSRSSEWLDMTWYPDELMLINMNTGGHMDAFYNEAEARLLSLAEKHAEEVEPSVISDAVRLNRALLKQPFLNEDIWVTSNYNIWEIYQAALRGEKVVLKTGEFDYEIDRTTQHWGSWEDWCREVIWYGNKRGDYIYPAKQSLNYTSTT